MFLFAEQLKSQQNKTLEKDQHHNVSQKTTTPSNEFIHASFPYNLKIVKEVLGVLKNADCVRDTVKVFEAMTNHEKWALESKSNLVRSYMPKTYILVLDLFFIISVVTFFSQITLIQ